MNRRILCWSTIMPMVLVHSYIFIISIVGPRIFIEVVRHLTHSLPVHYQQCRLDSPLMKNINNDNKGPIDCFVTPTTVEKRTTRNQMSTLWTSKDISHKFQGTTCHNQMPNLRNSEIYKYTLNNTFLYP